MFQGSHIVEDDAYRVISTLPSNFWQSSTKHATRMSRKVEAVTWICRLRYHIPRTESVVQSILDKTSS